MPLHDIVKDKEAVLEDGLVWAALVTMMILRVRMLEMEMMVEWTGSCTRMVPRIRTKTRCPRKTGEDSVFQVSRHSMYQAQVAETLMLLILVHQAHIHQQGHGQDNRQVVFTLQIQKEADLLARGPLQVCRPMLQEVTIHPTRAYLLFL
jgi:hypothetical protein